MNELTPYTLRQLVVYFLKLGTIGFGGPVALVGYMHRDLVKDVNGFPRMNIKRGLH
jgi:chromate transporter